MEAKQRLQLWNLGRMELQQSCDSLWEATPDARA
jgi:hypothetical protein